LRICRAANAVYLEPASLADTTNVPILHPLIPLSLSFTNPFCGSFSHIPHRPILRLAPAPSVSTHFTARLRTFLISNSFYDSPPYLPRQLIVQFALAPSASLTTRGLSIIRQYTSSIYTTKTMSSESSFADLLSNECALALSDDEIVEDVWSRTGCVQLHGFAVELQKSILDHVRLYISCHHGL
jgi:hypothetical protein